MKHGRVFFTVGVCTHPLAFFDFVGRRMRGLHGATTVDYASRDVLVRPCGHDAGGCPRCPFLRQPMWSDDRITGKNVVNVIFYYR